MKKLKDSKPIVLRVAAQTDNRLDPRPKDMATMTIYPHHVIGFRPNRSKTEYTITISQAFTMALRQFERDMKPIKKIKKVRRGLLSLERHA